MAILFSTRIQGSAKSPTPSTSVTHRLFFVVVFLGLALRLALIGSCLKPRLVISCITVPKNSDHSQLSRSLRRLTIRLLLVIAAHGSHGCASAHLAVFD